MMEPPTTPSTQPNLMAAMRYQDADAAIAWMEAALGMKQRALYRDAAGRVAHAELTFETPGGLGMVMIGSVRAEGEMDAAPWYRQPAQMGGVTSSIYLVVPDCAPVYAMALAAKAEVLSPLQTMEYGGAAFGVRDPEGFVWGVGEYNPWAQQQ